LPAIDPSLGAEATVVGQRGLASPAPGAGAMAVGERGLPSPAPSPAPSVAGVKRRAPVDSAEPDTEGKGKRNEKDENE
jgi:hypothetical protein